MRWKTARKLFPTSRRDTLICIGILSLAMLLCSMLRFLSEGDVYAALIFETAVIFVSRYTNGYLYGLVSSVIGVIGVNYMFTYPYFSLNFTISGYPLTFLVMITVAIIVGAMTTQLKQQEKVRAEAEKEKMRGNLLRAVSHDLRTPLTSIIGATNAVLDNDQALPPETKNELMQDVRDEAQWLLGVVENLLLVTRIGDEPTSLHKDMEAAEEIVSAMKEQIAAVEEAVAGAEPVKVFVYDMAQEGGAYTCGDNFTAKLISHAGGVNIFEDMDTTWATVSWEEVVERAPEVIVINDYGSTSLEEKIEELKENPALADVPAIRDGRITSVTLCESFASSMTGDTIEKFARSFHPDCFQ